MAKTCGLRVFFVLVLVIALGACTPQELPVKQDVPSGAANPVVSSGTEPVTLKVGYLPTSTWNPIFVALELGYFAEEGIQVELESFRSGGEMIAPLGLGQLDVGAGEIGTGLFNAVEQGMDIRVVAALSALREGHSYINLLVRKELKDSGEVTQVADLAGKKVAVNATRGVSEYMLYKILATANLTVDDVEMVIMPFPDMVQAIANGAVDAVFLHYPLAGQALDPGPNGEPPSAEILFWGEQIPGLPQASVISYGKTMLDPANHDTAVRFLKALLKGFRALQGEEWRENDAIVAAISKYTKVPVETVRKLPITYHEPNGVVDRTSMEDIQAYYVSRGYTEYSEPLPLEKVIDVSLVEAALKQLGEFK